ncbi:MAG: Gfo/Idh/MocA family oxidoreductase [Pseudomonadota bacterium]
MSKSEHSSGTLAAASPRPARAGVAGAGVFGGYHAQKYAALADLELADPELADVDFVGVFDPSKQAREQLAQKHGVIGFDTFSEFLAAVDMVTIAAPGAMHADLALQAISAGKHVYIEKPIALSVQNGREIIDAAANAGVRLAVGHQERVVFDALTSKLPKLKPTRLEFVRIGPGSGRCEDVSAVLDLMVHDLDLVGQFGIGELKSVFAAGDEHEIAATLTFDGCSASFLASRRSNERARAIHIHRQGEPTIVLDFIARTVNVEGEALTAAPDCPQDPLGVHVKAFADAVRGRPARFVTGQDGLNALELALKIEEARQSLATADNKMSTVSV